MPGVNHITFICLGVRSMPESLRFYKALGFHTTTEGDNPPVAFFDNAGSRMELFPIDALARDINREFPPAPRFGGFPGFTLAINRNSPEEVDQTMALALVSGARLAKKPEASMWGGYSGYFQDLNGYYWEVAYAPEFTIGEDGQIQ
jgi:predicted lactoylglutathione lyase